MEDKKYPSVEISPAAINMTLEVELFLRVFGRLPTKDSDTVTAAVARKYLGMWANKNLQNYDPAVRRFAFEVIGREVAS